MDSRSYEYQKYYIKTYYEKNKEYIRAHAREKILCECGSKICRADLSVHKRSQKHQNYLKSFETLNICISI